MSCLKVKIKVIVSETLFQEKQTAVNISGPVRNIWRSLNELILNRPERAGDVEKERWNGFSSAGRLEVEKDFQNKVPE